MNLGAVPPVPSYLLARGVPEPSAVAVISTFAVFAARRPPRRRG
jgi:hypothetical protein